MDRRSLGAILFLAAILAVLAAFLFTPLGDWLTIARLKESREALAGLGYQPEEIRDVLRELPTDLDAPTVLRDALKALGARRA